MRTELQTRRQPLYRRLGSRLFNLLLRLSLGLNLTDTQCGFKAFNRKAALTIFPVQQIERWAFDAELLYLARKFHLAVAEVPVAWAHRDGTRMHPFRDGAYMVGDLFRVRWNAISRKYKQPAKVDNCSVAKPAP